MENVAGTRAAAGRCVHCFYSGPSGASAVAVNLACRLADRIPQAAILYGVPAPRASYLQALDGRGIPWEYVPKAPGPRPAACLRAARRLADRAGGEGIAVLHGMRLFPVLGALRWLRPRVAAIGYAHGPTEELRGPRAWRAVGTALAADHLICVTEELRRMLGRLPLCGRAARAAVVVLNGVDPSFWQPDPARRVPVTGDMRLCFAGVLSARKRADLALDALAALRERGLAAHLELCGDGPERTDLERRVRALHLQDAVVFRGLLPPEAMRAALAASHVLIHTSRSEGLSMAVLEALGCGCPVVLCAPPASPAGPALFGPGSGVVLARDATGEGVADAVAALVAEPAVWARQAQEARDTVVRRFSLNEQADLFLALLAAWWPQSGRDDTRLEP